MNALTTHVVMRVAEDGAVTLTGWGLFLVIACCMWIIIAIIQIGAAR